MILGQKKHRNHSKVNISYHNFNWHWVWIAWKNVIKSQTYRLTPKPQRTDNPKFPKSQKSPKSPNPEIPNTQTPKPPSPTPKSTYGCSSSFLCLLICQWMMKGAAAAASTAQGCTTEGFVYPAVQPLTKNGCDKPLSYLTPSVFPS